ncbi:MAG TPA: MFS transporter [Thermoanaerobaculaceae bacterium]|nr:MFS transporter [Thermoanaerobaculaceae bacterium]
MGTPQPQRFPRVFWTANLTELCERAAYYSMASFVVIYLGQLGLGDYWPSRLNGALWTLIYFLPILSGTIADQIGFRRALLGAFVLLTAGYFLMGYPVWFGGAQLKPVIERELTAGAWTLAPTLVAIVLIGVGGSLVKPSILGTAQKVAGARAALAFSIFYVVVNVGSLTGRGISYFVRTRTSLAMIYAVAMGCAVVAFFVVLLFYRDVEAAPGGAPARPRRSVREIVVGMFRVLRSGRFVLFLTVISGFFFLYYQVYDVLPRYAKKVVETNPAMDIYTMANPLTIVLFQLLVTKLFGKLKPVRSIIVGIVIISLSMALNLIPIHAAGGLRAATAVGIPLGSLFVVLTIAAAAFGELFTSARMYEYVGALAPKGQEGLFLGYANLPLAIGSFTGGLVGPVIFNEVMASGAARRADGLLDLDPGRNARGWLILMTIGLLSALSMWLFNRWLEKQKD